MHSSLVLIEGNRVDAEDLGISLANAKQIVLGRAPDYGHLLHIAAESPRDLQAAVQEFSTVASVTGVITLAVRLTG